MNKLRIKSKQILFIFSDIEKKHKIITYASLLFLTISTYFLRSENENVKIESATLKEKNIGLIQNLIIFNRTYEGFPLPIWQKVKRGDKFIMNYINPEFLKMIGHDFDNNEYEIMGKNDFELFPQNIAQLYYENDIAVSITGEDLNVVENIIDKDGNIRKAKVIKWRYIKDNKDTLIYGMVKEFLPLNIDYALIKELNNK
tara:strand:- start:2403 stop:3002 length:600 start_codon:yes stop_codon:yes gene_type:complete